MLNYGIHILMSGSQTITCPECSTAIILPEKQATALAGQSLSCPVCSAPLEVSITKTLHKTAAPPSVAGKPVRLNCPKCFSQFTLSYDAACRMAGKNMNCLKCEAEIVMPPMAELVPPSSPSMATESDSISMSSIPAESEGPAKKPCSICFVMIESDAVFCPHCGGRQSKLSHPTGGNERNRTARLKLHKATGSTDAPCIKCGKLIHPGLDVCPVCNTYQKTGEHGKITVQPVGWQKERKSIPKARGALHKVSMAVFAIVLLTILTFICFKIYKWIISQLPQ